MTVGRLPTRLNGVVPVPGPSLVIG